MKIIIYSDLHLEFGESFTLPTSTEANLLILAGDIITFRNYEPLARFLKTWLKPVLYVTGNHEYYNGEPILEAESRFREWLKEHCPQVHLLVNEDIQIDGVNFFGGTMWTDFNQGNPQAMDLACNKINDFHLIRTAKDKLLLPSDTIEFHRNYLEKLLNWFNTKLSGPRVVITHHAPVINQKTKYGNSPLRPVFNSLDMLEIIKKYQPELWVYGHTHECDSQIVGQTRIVSNQRGYPQGLDIECQDFDPQGILLEVLQPS